MNRNELLDTAVRVRRNVLRMGHIDRRGFIAQGIGAADFLTGLFFYAMNYRPGEPEWEGRDRFLLSAGHNAIAVYAAMAEAGMIPEEWLDTYGLDGSHVTLQVSWVGLQVFIAARAELGSKQQAAVAQGLKCQAKADGTHVDHHARLPGAISAYNMMIVKNFFQGIPQELGAYMGSSNISRPLSPGQHSGYRRCQRHPGGRPDEDCSGYRTSR